MTESLKIRFKQEWHIRWPHFNFADLDLGISSDKHVKHSTLFHNQYGPELHGIRIHTAFLAHDAVEQ